ncbi:MAG TPA: peptide-binding protein [Methylomirabilota bacterium]|nr:peptide-binding protein [Methylomirabilota bacterium]
MRPRRALALLALGACYALLPGCGTEVEGRIDDAAAGSDTPAYGDTFVMASIGDIGGLIPSLTSDSASHEVGGLIYDGLIRLDKNLNFAPAIAESWTFSKDCLTLTFKLRKDVKWHDGHPFTAEDVRFTWQTMVNPKTPAPFKDMYLQVKDVEVLDPYTVRITHPAPYARALETWGDAMLPKHLLEPYVADGKLRESPQNRNPIGTGPYRFREWRPGEKVVLLANPDYYEGRPYIGRVVYRIIPSQATIFLELKAKGVDYSRLTAFQYVRQTDYPAFRKAYNRYRYPGSAYTFFGFNLKDPRFADKRVRQAFAHAINKQELIDGVALGLAREAYGSIRPGTWAYTDRVKRYEFNPEKAKALLAEAGWKDRDSNGFLRDKDGRPFAFTIRTNQGNDERKKIAEIIQQRLQDIGVKADIQVIEWAAFIKEFVKPRRFEAVILGLGTGTDPDQFMVWHSSQAGPDQMNRTGYASPEADALLEVGRASCIQGDRLKYYLRLQELLAEDLPMIFLYFNDTLPVVARRFRGIDPGPAGIFYNFNEWYVPRPLQRYTAG